MIEQGNQGFAIQIEHHHYLTKNRKDATSFVHIDKTAKPGVKIIRELKEPNYTHKYNMKSAIKEINARLQKAQIDFEINRYIFGLFNKVYGIKENEKYCYVHTQYKNPMYTYSMQAIDLIYNEIVKDSQNIKSKLESIVKNTNKPSTLGARDS